MVLHKSACLFGLQGLIINSLICLHQTSFHNTVDTLLYFVRSLQQKAYSEPFESHDVCRQLCVNIQFVYMVVCIFHQIFMKYAQSIYSNISRYITKTRLFNYIENFTTKNWKFSDKNSDSFQISA